MDDLRSEVGSLRLQVVDMDSRIEALSRMVDRLLEERATGGIAVPAEVGKDASSAQPRKTWTKRRRVEEDHESSERNSGDVEASVPCVKEDMETSCDEIDGDCETGPVQVKAEPTPGDSFPFQNDAVGENPVPAVQAQAVEGGGEGGDPAPVIVGGGPLTRGGGISRDSFLGDLDNMSLGSVDSLGSIAAVSLSSLEPIDVNTSMSQGGVVGGVRTADADEAAGSSAGGTMGFESLFDIDFDAEITAMTPTGGACAEHQGLSPQLEGSLSRGQQRPAAVGSSAVGAAGRAVPGEIDLGNVSSAVGSIQLSSPAEASSPEGATGMGVSQDQAARIEELKASLDSMPPDSKLKLAEGLLALAQNPGMVATMGGAGVSDPRGTLRPGVPVASRSTPEIAMPLASAALGAFMVRYAQAQAVKEPASSVAAAVNMDPTQHALKRTASLR